MPEKFETPYKILLLGSAESGKSQLVNRLAGSPFVEKYTTTIGIDFKLRTTEDEQIKFQIWDTAGQERFSSITTSYIKKNDAYIITYDPNNRASFEEAKKYYEKIKDAKNIFLVATKSDIKLKEDGVKEEEAKAFTEKLNVKFIKTSAKTENDPGVKNLIDALIENVKLELEQKNTSQAPTANKIPTQRNPILFNLLALSIIASIAAAYFFGAIIAGITFFVGAAVIAIVDNFLKPKNTDIPPYTRPEIPRNSSEENLGNETTPRPSVGNTVELEPRTEIEMIDLSQPQTKQVAELKLDQDQGSDSEYDTAQDSPVKTPAGSPKKGR